MKTKIAALALLLFAGAASTALAQDRGEGRRERFDREPNNAAARDTQRAQPDVQRDSSPEFHRESPRERPTPPPAPVAPEARPAPEAPVAREGRGGGGGWRGGGEGRRPDVPTVAERPAQPTPGPTVTERPGRQDRDGLNNGGRWTRDRNPPTPSTDPRTDRDRRPDGDRADRNGRGGDGRWDRDGRGGDRNGRGGDGNDQGRDGNWNGRDRNGDNSRWDRNGRDGDHRWDRGHFRPAYQSPRRYRGSFWRPPLGFYAYSWSFGDVLPRSWYGSNYRILNWWSYGLPEPPPGCNWVRVGYDAILVDDFDGQVLEVVRLVFF